MAAGAPGQPPVLADVVTLCQVELNKLSELLFGTVGELQRDAKPSSIGGEAVIHDTGKAYDAKARADGFAKELMGCVANLQTLVQQLPEPPDPDQQLARIKALQQQSEELSKQLQQEQQGAELKLQQAQDLYAVLGMAALKHKKQLGGGMADGLMM